jgi:predicted metal-dependent hydrolase
LTAVDDGAGTARRHLSEFPAPRGHEEEAPAFWPEYRVRKSRRARQVRFTMSLRDGLVVVVPSRFDIRRIPDLLQARRAWLERAAGRVEEERKARESKPLVTLPGCIALPGTGEEWTLDYRATGSARVVALERAGNRLLLLGDTGKVESCRAALGRWLNRKAHQRLEPWLVGLAAERGFAMNRVVVKSQRTRWASCSRRGTISLNVRLLFVPEDLVCHVLIHELCHTVHMNHSREFKALLERHDPDWRDHRRRLRAAWRAVPAWLTGPLG